MDETGPLVLDSGRFLTRAGYALNLNYEDTICTPSLYGVLRHLGVMSPCPGLPEFYVCDAAERRRGILTLTKPDKLTLEQREKIWKYSLFETRAVPEEHNLLFALNPQEPKENLYPMMQFCFETLRVPGLCFRVDAELSLLSQGYTSGCVVDLGSGHRVTPVYEGSALLDQVQSSSVSGPGLSEYLISLCQQRGVEHLSEPQARKILEKDGYVSLNFNPDERLPKPPLMTTSATVYGDEIYRVPEAIFRPELMGLEERGIHQLVFDCFQAHQQLEQSCPSSLNLFSKVLLSGGTCLLNGLRQRLQSELNQTLSPHFGSHLFDTQAQQLSKDTTCLFSRVPPDLRRHSKRYLDDEDVRVIAPRYEANACFVGGCMYASSPWFEAACTSREQYEEVGETVERRRLERLKPRFHGVM